MRLLLGTDAYSALKRGHTLAAELVRRSDEVLLSTVAAGVLLHGIRCGSRFVRTRQELDEFIASPSVKVIHVTMATADRFSRVAATRRRRGTPMPANDIRVAAQAMESEAELLTRDRHCEAVDGLAWRRLE